MDETAQREILRLLHVQSRDYVAPLYWGTDPYNAATILHNASCFFLEIGAHRFGVTANHVIAAYQEARARHPNVHFVIRNTIFDDIEAQAIDADTAIDVFTFSVTEQQFAEIAAKPYKSAPKHWPPAPPQADRGVVMTGYAEAGRTVLGKKAVEFEQSSNTLVAAAVERDKIEIQVQREHLRPLGTEQIPSMTLNLSGFSGSPLWTVEARPHELFRFGGVVLHQFPARTEDERNVIFARRAECIRADGTLDRDYTTRRT